MRLISDRILWTLEIISLFDEAVSCPVLRTNFLVVLVRAFGYHLSVVNCRFYFLRFSRLNAYKIFERLLEIARGYRQRLGLTWYFHYGFA